MRRLLETFRATDPSGREYEILVYLEAQAVNINKKKQSKESPKELMAVLLQELNVNMNKPGHLDDLPGNMEAA